MFSDEPVQIFGSSRQQIARRNSASLDINLKHSIELLIQNSVAPNNHFHNPSIFGRSLINNTNQGIAIYMKQNHFVLERSNP
jgi:hypothetical protein